MRKHISQSEAHRMRKELAALKERDCKNNRYWAGEYFGGMHLGSITRDADWLNGQIHAARKLGHAVIVTTDTEQKKLTFYAVKK